MVEKLNETQLKKLVEFIFTHMGNVLKLIKYNSPELMGCNQLLYSTIEGILSDFRVYVKILSAEESDE